MRYQGWTHLACLSWHIHHNLPFPHKKIKIFWILGEAGSYTLSPDSMFFCGLLSTHTSKRGHSYETFLSFYVFCHWTGPVFINTIQFCLLWSSLAVNNPFCILFSSTSLITFPLSCRASFFLSFTLRLLSLVMSNGVTHMSQPFSQSQCFYQCPLFFCQFQYFVIGFVPCRHVPLYKITLTFFSSNKYTWNSMLYLYNNMAANSEAIMSSPELRAKADGDWSLWWSTTNPQQEQTWTRTDSLLDKPIFTQMS